MASKIDEVIQQIVLNGPVPSTELAEICGKSHKTLLREVNPEDKKAKLGAETLMKIMEVTGIIEPLKIMAQELNFDLVPEEDK